MNRPRDAPETEVDLDDVMSALSNVHRRRMLAELRESNPHGEVPEASRDPGDGDELAVAMVHQHLPKLAAMGFVDWDRETETVRRGRNFEAVVPVLEFLSEGSDESR